MLIVNKVISPLLGYCPKKFPLFLPMPGKAETFPGSNSYHDFLIIPTISGKADNYRLLLKKGRDNFFKKGRYLIARIQMP